MRVALLLLRHSLKRMRTLVLSIGFLLAGFQLMMIVVARSLQRSGGFEQLVNLIPPFARELLGPSLASFMSFGGIVSVGYFDVPVIGAVVGLAIALATIPAAEVESGFMDLILSRPLARHWIITRTILAELLVLALVLALMVLATGIGLHTLVNHPASPSTRLIHSLAVNLGLLGLCWGGIAMAIGAAARRRGFAGGVAGLLALAAFLLDYVGRLWEPAEAAARLSPFRYFSPFDLVMGNPLPMKNLVVLGSVAAAGFAAAYILFARRDISH